MAKKENLGKVWKMLAVTRVMLGFVFLWAFLDKLFGLGFSTAAEKGWLVGGSPTAGFLKGVDGPFASFFNSLSGLAVSDWLFMLGLLGIGVALICGVAMKIAAWSGAIMMLLMWAASLPLENNPVIDEHIIYASVLLVLVAANSQQRYSLANWWKNQALVKRNAWLQ